MGLPPTVQDLVILTFAEQTNRAFRFRGGPAEAEIGGLENEMVLEEVALPSEEVWLKASDRAKTIFGIPTSPLLNAANLTNLAGQITEHIKIHSPDVTAVSTRLTEVQANIFPEIKDCARLNTIREAQSLLKTLSSSSGNEIVRRLAEFSLKSNLSALGTAISSGRTVDRSLESADWKIFQSIRALVDDRASEVQAIWQDLERAFSSDEYAVSLAPKIAELKGRAVDLLTREIIPPPPRPPLPTKTIEKLKALYGRSQADGDDLPTWLKAEAVRDVLAVHFFGTSASDADDWKSMLVVSPTLKALIELDPGAKVDLRNRVLNLPRFGQKIKLTVDPQHLE
jgi:hypothetical protein